MSVSDGVVMRTPAAALEVPSEASRSAVRFSKLSMPYAYAADHRDAPPASPCAAHDSGMIARRLGGVVERRRRVGVACVDPQASAAVPREDRRCCDHIGGGERQRPDAPADFEDPAVVHDRAREIGICQRNVVRAAEHLHANSGTAPRMPAEPPPPMASVDPDRSCTRPLAPTWRRDPTRKDSSSTPEVAAEAACSPKPSTAIECPCASVAPSMAARISGSPAPAPSRDGNTPSTARRRRCAGRRCRAR